MKAHLYPMLDMEVELELIEVDFNEIVSVIDHNVSSHGNQGEAPKRDLELPRKNVTVQTVIWHEDLRLWGTVL